MLVVIQKMHVLELEAEVNQEYIQRLSTTWTGSQCNLRKIMLIQMHKGLPLNIVYLFVI